VYHLFYVSCVCACCFTSSFETSSRISQIFNCSYCATKNLITANDTGEAFVACRLPEDKIKINLRQVSVYTYGGCELMDKTGI
jgi:hypothetical protein